MAERGYYWSSRHCLTTVRLPRDCMGVFAGPLWSANLSLLESEVATFLVTSCAAHLMAALLL